MSSEIVVPETPNWLNALEEKRERRLKARLGHEAGAGAPCLKCADKCPGLDLHFWRKNCKICRCPKEEHDVHDDDIYGWAQFQLLGSKPNKIKTKIVLPGKKDEVELDWAPKGNKDTIDKYLKTLPPETLPVKGSQAAQDRKQLLQKQIPIHDIDPTLCHELNEDEMNKMNEYITYVKESSVGVGQVVNLSSIIKGNLHNIGPQEAAIIASRYAKGIPLSEIVKLQGYSSATPLQSDNLNNQLEDLRINPSDSRNVKNLPNFVSNTLNKPIESSHHPSVYSKVKDINYGGHINDSCVSKPHLQYSSGFKPGQYAGPFGSKSNENPQYNIDENLLKSTNFDPKKTPSQFLPSVPYSPSKLGQGNYHNIPNSLPYQKITGEVAPVGYITENVGKPAAGFAQNIPLDNKIGNDNNDDQCGYENPFYANQLGNSSMPVGQRNSQNMQGEDNQNNPYDPASFSSQIPGFHQIPNDNAAPIKNLKSGLPNYAPGKYNVYGDIQEPRAPQNIKDLAFSTYSPQNLEQIIPEGYTGDRQMFGNVPEQRNPSSPAGQFNLHQNLPGSNQDVQKSIVGQFSLGENKTHPESNRSQQNFGNVHAPKNPLSQFAADQLNLNQNVPERNQDLQKFGNVQFPQKPFSQTIPGQLNLEQNVPEGDRSQQKFGNVQLPNKHLSQFVPGQLNVSEDYLHPSQVNIGAIRDINYPEVKRAGQGVNNYVEDTVEDYSPDSIREILNNIKLPDCHHCKKPFEENEFAVTIDKSDALFHAGCFKCAGCNQSLADNIYFYHKETDNIYCGRDFAKVRGIPRCNACDELIFTKEYCLAENSTFHLKHFCCIECDVPLAGLDYTLEDEMPYCLPCFENSKASKCGTCERVIKPDEMGCTLNNVHFHAVDQCFACIMCQKPLMGKKLLLRNEKLYCSHECYNKVK